ncbi:Uncharacterised protein [Mycobacteroides abscessus subsp. abscessus]|nr:Uncharacterised protein [Mycobacteroides abscessus subsp. abscessus]
MPRSPIGPGLGVYGLVNPRQELRELEFVAARGMFDGGLGCARVMN